MSLAISSALNFIWRETNTVKQGTPGIKFNKLNKSKEKGPTNGLGKSILGS